jgi:DNA-binding PadR family transcriptional regulator
LAKIHRRTHLPAFLLLFLKETPDYGASLLGRIKDELPYFLTDSSNVYRTLQEMEEKGLVSTQWEIAQDDTPRKWYAITPAGDQELDLFYQDIKKRHANLSFFLDHYYPTKKSSQ